MSGFKNGSVVKFAGRRGTVHGVVYAQRWISKGRNAGQVEYKVAPFERRGTEYSWTVLGRALTASEKTFTEEQIKAAVELATGTKAKVEERKEKRAEEGRAAIGDIDFEKSTRTKTSGTEIAVGDQVLIRWSNSSPTWETVGNVNLGTGKIGIKRAERAVDYAVARAILMQSVGRRSVVRELRWIPASLVIEVRKP